MPAQVIQTPSHRARTPTLGHLRGPRRTKSPGAHPASRRLSGSRQRRAGRPAAQGLPATWRGAGQAAGTHAGSPPAAPVLRGGRQRLASPQSPRPPAGGARPPRSGRVPARPAPPRLPPQARPPLAAPRSAAAARGPQPPRPRPAALGARLHPGASRPRAPSVPGRAPEGFPPRAGGPAVYPLLRSEPGHGNPEPRASPPAPR